MVPGPVFDAGDDIGDESFASVASDDFGFFAAQKKIHAMRDRQKNFAPTNDREAAHARPSRTNVRASLAEASFDESFSRPAFGTPRGPARTKAQDLDHDTPGTNEPGPSSGKRRSLRKSDATAAESEDEGADEEVVLTLRERSRRKKAVVIGAKPARGRGKGKASTRKASGSSAGRRPPAKKPKDDGEEIDIRGGSSGDEVRDHYFHLLTPTVHRVL